MIKMRLNKRPGERLGVTLGGEVDWTGVGSAATSLN